MNADDKTLAGAQMAIDSMRSTAGMLGLSEDLEMIERFLFPRPDFKMRPSADPVAVFVENVNRKATQGKSEKLAPFMTGPFKCLDDYDACVHREHDRRLCAAIAVICIGKHLIPFAPRG